MAVWLKFLTLKSLEAVNTVGRCHLLFFGLQLPNPRMGDHWFGVLMSGYLGKGSVVLRSCFTWMPDWWVDTGFARWRGEASPSPVLLTE